MNAKRHTHTHRVCLSQPEVMILNGRFMVMWGGDNVSEWRCYPVIAQLLHIHLSSDVHLKISRRKGERFRGGREKNVSVCVCMFLCETALKIKAYHMSLLEHVEGDCCAAVSNGLCLAIQRRFKRLERWERSTEMPRTHRRAWLMGGRSCESVRFGAFFFRLPRSWKSNGWRMDRLALPLLHKTWFYKSVFIYFLSLCKCMRGGGVCKERSLLKFTKLEKTRRQRQIPKLRKQSQPWCRTLRAEGALL